MAISEWPHVVVYEEVLREAGRSLHAAVIADRAEAKGMLFNGKTSKAKMVRNALQSCTRFVNVGGNRWWLTDTKQEEAK